MAGSFYSPEFDYFLGKQGMGSENEEQVKDVFHGGRIVICCEML
jgi:hypothetical protein